MIRVKICGICDLESARAAVEAGADLIGFHFCDSDRRVSPEAAREILEGLRRARWATISTSTSCSFTGPRRRDLTPAGR